MINPSDARIFFIRSSFISILFICQPFDPMYACLPDYLGKIFHYVLNFSFFFAETPKEADESEKSEKPKKSKSKGHGHDPDDEL